MDEDTPETLDKLGHKRKRLHFRAWHRGTRELDLIMGSFADRYIDGFNAQALADFEALLDLAEPDLYAWLTGQSAVPANLDTDVFRALQAHRPPQRGG